MQTIWGIAVEPPKSTAVAQKRVNGMVVTEVQGGIRALTAVFAGEMRMPSGVFVMDIEPGDTIYVSSLSLAKFPWAQEVFEVDGKPFIVVPHEFVISVKKP